MKKLLFTLLALVGFVSAAWAQTVVTAPKASTAEVRYTYTLACQATSGHTSARYMADNGTILSGSNAEGTLFEFETADGGFYMKSCVSGKYVNAAGTTQGAEVSLGEEKQTIWTVSVMTGSTNGVVFKPAGSSYGLNNAGGTNNMRIWTAASTGNACSMWTVTEYEEQAEPLTWAEVKNGYTYAIVNVQPAAAGKNYYMNNTEGVLTPTDATGFNSLSSWPTTAQFVAEKQVDGKFAFKNVANGLYLAYKSHNTGENNRSGFYATVEAWSAWTMNKSTRSGFEGTYWPVCSGRANGNNTASTLLILNNGTWNAWSANECTDARYSNNFGFVELAAPTAPEYTITFNFTGAAEGTLTTTVREGNVPTLPVTIPSYVSYSVTPELTAVTGDATYTVNSSYQESFLPFEPNGDKFYTIKMNRNPKLNIYVDPTDNTKIKTTATASTEETREYYQWAFGGDWLNGFSLKNKEVEKFVSYGEQGVNNTNNKKAALVDAVEPGATFDIEKSGNYFFLKIHGSTSNYISNNGGAGTTDLTTWNNRDYNDGGSQLIIEEAVDALTEAKNTAIASLPNHIPVLFDYAAGVAAINAATSIEAVNTAKENYMKTAEGKKFSIKSTQSNHPYLDAAGTTLDATSTTLKATGVYQLKYVEGTNQYKLFVVKNNTYVKNNTATNAPSAITADEAEAGVFFIGNVNGTDNDIYLTKVLSGWNAIHYNSNYTGHNCVWEYNSGASQWTIEAVSDEQWEAMTALPDVTALQTLIDNTKAGYYDEWNGVWRIGAGLNNYNYITEPAVGMDLQTYLTTAQDFIDNLSSENTEAEIAQHISNINSIISNLAINQPSDGSFIRIRSVKAGMGYVNGEASTAHEGCLAVGGKKASSIFYYKDGKLLSYTEGQYIIKNNCGAGFAALGATGAEGAAIVFGQATKQTGCYTITYNGRYLYAADNASNTDAGGSEGNNGYDFWLEEVESLPVSVSAAKYATLYAPVALEIPEGVTAYTLAENGNYLTATELSDKIPANTGVVLSGEANDYNFSITTGGEGESCLSGSVATTATPANVYTLANGEDGIGFYNYTGESVKGFKSYYKNTSADARGFAIDFGGETGVGMVNEMASQQEGKIYNLAGQRVQKAQKGIYIINGKKVLK